MNKMDNIIAQANELRLRLQAICESTREEWKRFELDNPVIAYEVKMEAMGSTSASTSRPFLNAYA